MRIFGNDKPISDMFGYSFNNDDLQIYPSPVLLGQKRFKLYTVEQSKKTTDKEAELFPIKTDAPKDAH